MCELPDCDERENMWAKLGVGVSKLEFPICHHAFVLTTPREELGKIPV